MKPSTKLAIRASRCLQTKAVAETFDIAVVGAGMVGTAAAAHLSQSLERSSLSKVALIGPSSQPSYEWPHSSHDDASRAVYTISATPQLAEESIRSISAYRNVEQETGVRFFHEVGLLTVSSCAEETERGVRSAGGERLEAQELKRRWPFMTFPGEVYAHLQATGAGWIEPREHVRAHLNLSRSRGVDILEGAATKLEREGELWSVQINHAEYIVTKKVVFTLGAFTNLSGLIPKDSSLEYDVWGKAVFHARLAEEEATALLRAGMPVVMWKFSPSDNTSANSLVSYEGHKKGSYVYFFPPTRYSDGNWYIKIGHSPFDPLIGQLSGETETEKLRKWMQGEGDDVVDLRKQSEKFFTSTLQTLFPDATFLEGGYLSPCVTSRSRTGEVILGALPSKLKGLYACSGCNGAGAQFAHEWGRQLSKIAQH